jgi:hypothetical protein
MTMQTEAQSYFDGVDLVTGSGERREGELCIMSLVALLAGEQHSDRPSTACPVITAFVIRINDAIDHPARQDLKDYATRIMGTNDGRHHDRAWLLTRECVNDVFARMMEAKGANGDAIAALPRMPLNADTSYDFKALSSELQAAGRYFGLARDLLKDMRYLLRAMREGRYELVASAAAVLIVDCAHPLALNTDENVYWDKAIEMFSRLCAVGENDRVPATINNDKMMVEINRARAGSTMAPILLWLFARLQKPLKTD